MPIRSTLFAFATLILFGSASAFADDHKDDGAFADIASGAPIALSDDPVAAGFQRMLTHEPNWTPPPVPQDFAKDPLLDELALPMLRWSTAGSKRIARCE